MRTLLGFILGATVAQAQPWMMPVALVLLAAVAAVDLWRWTSE